MAWMMSLTRIVARCEGEVNGFGEDIGLHFGELTLAEVDDGVLCEGLGAA